MKHFLTPLVLLLTVVSCYSQTKTLTKTLNNNALTESFIVPAGVSITINAGASIINNGTATGFGSGGSGSASWSSITSKPTTIAGFGIVDGITAAAAASTYQPLDADLTNLAALATTVFGRSLLTGADASATRTLLGLGTLATQSGTLSDYLTTATAASTYQPLDADLTNLAALATTVFGRSLLTGADASATRTTLGLAIGTNVLAPNGSGAALTGITNTQISGLGTLSTQSATITDYLTTATAASSYQPLDADLTSIAALTTTTHGRSLLTGADAAATRTTLGLGTLATQSGTLPIANGGTGETTASTARIALLPSMTGNGGKFLRVNAGATDYEVATISGGGDALTSGTLAQFAATTSAQLRGVLSDESGTGEFLTTNGSGASLTSLPAAAAGTLTGATLASNVVTSSLTSLGTVTTGVWQGTAIGDSYLSSASTWNAKESSLTFSTGLTRTTNTITINTSQNIATLSNLTSNGIVTTSGGTGALSVDTATKPKAEAVEHGFALSDETSDNTASTTVPKITFRMPHAMTLTAVRCSLTKAATGAAFIVDIHEAGATIMTTNKLSVDASETTSNTAATAATLTDTSLADDALIEVFIDQVGVTTDNTGEGVKVWIIGTR
jgi:hypothetical protein